MKRVFANPHVGDERDYGRDGEVERLVSQFLVGNRTEWFYLTDIATRFELDRKRLDRVLWRLFRKGKAQMRNDGRGYVQWRGR